MNWTRTFRVLALASLTATLAACDRGNALQPIEKTSALTSARSRIEHMLEDGARASAFLNDAKHFGEVLRAGCPESSSDHASSFGRCEDFHLPTAEEAMPAVSKMTSKIFAAENIESEDETHVILRLDPQIVCENGSRTDDDCVRALTRVPVRLALTIPEDDTLEVNVLVGDDRLDVVDLFLRPESIAAEVELDALKSSMLVLAESVGERAAHLPATLTGRVRASLAKTGAETFEGRVAIEKAISIATQGAEAFELKVAAADPVLVVGLDGARKTLSLDSTLSSVDLATSLSELLASVQGGANCVPGPDGHLSCMSSAPKMDARGRVHLGALRGSVVLDGADAITLTHLGIGDGLDVSVNDLPLLTFDLTSDTVSWVPDASGGRFAFTPGLTAMLGVRFKNVADLFEQAPPAWTLDDDLTLELSGSSPSIRMHDAGEMSDARVEVVSGTLELRARQGDRRVHVDAGMCLIAHDEETDTHPLDALASGICR